MKDAFAEDLSDFIRNGKLDAYELTDEELADFLEVWRWAAWRRRTLPSGPDADIVDTALQFQAMMQQTHGVEVDYNTFLLLRQELEPLMYLRILRELRRALLYFLQPRNLVALVRTLARAPLRADRAAGRLAHLPEGLSPRGHAPDRRPRARPAPAQILASRRARYAGQAHLAAIRQ